MSGYSLIVPELLVLAVVAWGMFAELLPGRDRGAAWVGAGLMAAAAVAAALAPAGGELFGGLLSFDATARFARTGIVALAALWMLWTAGRGEGRVREAVVLAALSTLGSMLMTEATEIVTLVLALELATMPAYVLIGYRRNRMNGLEGALKYFLLSMLTTLVMLYGLSFLYGVTGTTRFDAFDLSGAGTLGLLAVVLTYVGLFAKLSAAPFHYWTPDAYEGSEAWSVAFVSTVPKLAGAVAIVRLTAALSETAAGIGVALLAVAGASMVLGNLAALNQDDVRRMMAYSGVAHTGYLLLGVGTLTAAGFGSAVFYGLAYALPSLGVMLVVAEEGPLVTDLAGLSSRRPMMAWSIVVMLVSLIGIPPLVGFFGKLYLFVSAVEANLGGWVLLAVIMSVVSAAYYLRIVRAMFFAEPLSEAGTEVSIGVAGTASPTGPRSGAVTAAVAVVACALLALALGLAAGPLLGALGAPLG